MRFPTPALIFEHSPLRRLRDARHSGKPSRMTAGSWIDDLAALGKAIVLCSMCEVKFNARKYDYRAKDLWPGQKHVAGDCDGCKRHVAQARLFTKEF